MWKPPVGRAMPGRRRAGLIAGDERKVAWVSTAARSRSLAAKCIATAFVFAFMVSFDEVTVTVFVTGPTHQTLPVQIFGYLQNELDPSVTAISGLLVGLVMLGMLVTERVLGVRRMFAGNLKPPR
jgi:hypothetical protein